MLADEQYVYSEETGRPVDQSYLECGLPPYLQLSLDNMKEAWAKLERGEDYTLWDCDYCTLQSDINCAEVDQEITSEQAWYLRGKYLKLRKEDVT